MTRSIGSERLFPRTYGITQNEQRLSQPSCTFKLGRVRSLAASNTGAACSSVWAKMSETKIELRTADVSCAMGTKLFEPLSQSRSRVRGLTSAVCRPRSED